MSDSIPLPPGWYEDPENPRLWRYWKGDMWTEHRQPRDPQLPNLAPVTLPSTSSSSYVRSPAYEPQTPTANNPQPSTYAQPTQQPISGPHNHIESSLPTNGTNGAPPPGWYEDPENPRLWRYWNGITWTENRATHQQLAQHYQQQTTSEEETSIQENPFKDNQQKLQDQEDQQLVENIRLKQAEEVAEKSIKWFKTSWRYPARRVLIIAVPVLIFLWPEMLFSIILIGLIFALIKVMKSL
ncbi:MAG: DUF2510 domain-containing protein [Acidimicrobiaceae bacterium]|nr:DUF2510 domain-containing protein [Acidimicrobiaceae bacterium]